MQPQHEFSFARCMEKFTRQHIAYLEGNMFRCFNVAGEQVAAYPYLSQAQTYWTASVPAAQFDRPSDGGKGEIVVYNNKEEEVGYIRFPPDLAERDSDKPTLMQMLGEDGPETPPVPPA